MAFTLIFKGGQRDPQTCKGRTVKVSLLIHTKMATINNSDVQKRLIADAKIQIAVDAVPKELGKTVVPVLIANPKDNNNIIRNGVASNADATIYTTPSDKNFYLTGAQMSRIKDATSDNTYSYLRCTVNGKTEEIISFAGITLTAQIDNVGISFKPILLDRGSTIRLIKVASSVGVNVQAGSIIGFVTEE